MPPKNTYRKFIIAFILIIVIAFSIGLFWQYYYEMEQKQRRVDQAIKYNRDINNFVNKIYQEQLKDTYGGKTPQETLQMYIDAVEKGDYELASKYFVIDKQEKELESLKKAKQSGGIEYLLNEIQKIKFDNGYFSNEKDRFTIEEPIFIDFIIYPNGIWKIDEI